MIVYSEKSIRSTSPFGTLDLAGGADLADPLTLDDHPGRLDRLGARAVHEAPRLDHREPRHPSPPLCLTRSRCQPAGSPRTGGLSHFTCLSRRARHHAHRPMQPSLLTSRRADILGEARAQGQTSDGRSAAPSRGRVQHSSSAVTPGSASRLPAWRRPASRPTARRAPRSRPPRPPGGRSSTST